MNNKNCLTILLLLQSTNLFCAEWDFGDVMFPYDSDSEDLTTTPIEQPESRSSSKELTEESKKTLKSSSNIPVPARKVPEIKVESYSNPSTPRQPRRTKNSRR